MGAGGFAEAPRARGPVAARLRPLPPLPGVLGTPTALAGLPLKEGASVGMGLAGGTPSLGTARGGRAEVSLALPLLCPRASTRSGEAWPATRCAPSTLPARAFRLDGARPPGLASSEESWMVAAARFRLTAWVGARVAPFLCPRLDLRTGGAGGTTPPGLGERLPLGAGLLLLPSTVAWSPKEAVGMLTPSVVAPLRRAGIWAAASGRGAVLAATSHPSTTLWVHGGSPGAGRAEPTCSKSHSPACSSQGSPKRPPGSGGFWSRGQQPVWPASESILGLRGRLEWMLCAATACRGGPAWAGAGAMTASAG